jgi:hypothetical protein
MTELNISMAQNQGIDHRPQHFVKMFKDGTHNCELVPKGREEIDQCTMELEYIPQPPTDEEKIAYALTIEPLISLHVSEDIKRAAAAQIIMNPSFTVPAFDPNASRVHNDPTYFFVTPAKPVIWCWKRGTQEEAIATAEAFRQERLKVMKNGKSKWDMTVEVYKQQYNVVEA